MELHIIGEANRCLNCKKPMCRQGCPVHTEIPDIIKLFKNRKIMEAGEILFRNNPLSVVCAEVCDHKAQCTGHCVLGKNGSPIQFYDIEKYISESYLTRMPCQRSEKKEQKAAVIGAGAAGITAAFILASAGYGVTIFDEKDKIGGMMQYGIPDFRLSKSLFVSYKQKMRELGIQIRPNTVIGGALKIKDLFRDGYSAVLVGTGVWRPKALGIEGESLANVHYGISYLSNPAAYSLGENVVVIGMGNAAMDVARTALRNGARRVTLYARSRHISASSHEMSFTKLDGAEFVFGRAIKKITEEGPVFRVAIFDDEGQVAGYREKAELSRADSTIIAVSQGPKNKLILTTEGLQASEEGLLLVDENFMTTHEGVFAAGDVVHGSKTVVCAVKEAKAAASAMITYMEKKDKTENE